MPTLKRDHQALLNLAELEAGDSLLDLGSGAGGLLLAAARRGVTATGIELNPFLWAYSKLRTWPERQLITIKLGNYWQMPWPEVDCVYVFLIGRYMSKLDRELSSRLKRQTKVVSYVFDIPGRKPLNRLHNAKLYLYEIDAN